MTLTSYVLAAEAARINAAKVTTQDRKKHGMRTRTNAKGNKPYPIKNHAQAISAINMRHHAKPPLTPQELSNLLTRAAQFAPKEAAAARAKDRKNGYL